MKSITVVSEDKVGLLADISSILAKSKINIDAISVAVVSNKAVIAMEVTNPSKSKEILEAAGYRVESNNLVIRLNHNELEGLAERLSKEGVKLEKASVLTKDEKYSVVSLSVDKPKRASVLLQEKLLSNQSDY